MLHKTRRGAQIHKSRVVFEGKIFRVRRDVILEPPLPGGGQARGTGKGRTVSREIVEHGGSVVLLPVLPDGRILLVRQYRYPTDDFLWELVAGHIGPGEKPHRAARRELEEETGYQAGRLEMLVQFFPTPGFLTERMCLYRTRALRRGPARPRADEALEAHAFSQAELQRMICSGEVRDGKTLIGLLLHWQGLGRKRRARS